MRVFTTMSELENHEDAPESVKRRGIYLLPNLFTTAGLFSGFYAIVAAMTEQFHVAAIALFIAMIMDTLDGRVARLTGTQSEFGAQYDSLSDMVCFGITPALVVYSWGLRYLGKLGWIAAFVYAAATALRLARFNIQSEHQDKNIFLGLPCPAAAGIIAGLVWVCVDVEATGRTISQLSALLTVAVALLMVSSLRYQSFKELDFKGKVPFVAVLIVVLLYALIAFDPPKILFGIFFLYGCTGPMVWLHQKIFTTRNTAVHDQSKAMSEKSDENNIILIKDRL